MIVEVNLLNVLARLFTDSPKGVEAQTSANVSRMLDKVSGKANLNALKQSRRSFPVMSDAVRMRDVVSQLNRENGKNERLAFLPILSSSCSKFNGSLKYVW
jgi:hypothetical protein